MTLPKKLKNMNLFNDANSYAGVVAEVTLPTLSRKMEEWRGGGMAGPIKADLGQEAIELEWTCGGFMRQVFEQYGVGKHDGVMLRFAGGYQADDGSAPDAIEIVVRGRHAEIDSGSAKVGDDTAFKIKTACSYYKLTVNGQELIEIDMMNMVEKIKGTDLAAPIRTAIGL